MGSVYLHHHDDDNNDEDDEDEKDYSILSIDNQSTTTRKTTTSTRFALPRRNNNDHHQHNNNNHRRRFSTHDGTLNVVVVESNNDQHSRRQQPQLEHAFWDEDVEEEVFETSSWNSNNNNKTNSIRHHHSQMTTTRGRIYSDASTSVAVSINDDSALRGSVQQEHHRLFVVNSREEDDDDEMDEKEDFNDHDNENDDAKIDYNNNNNHNEREIDGIFKNLSSHNKNDQRQQFFISEGVPLSPPQIRSERAVLDHKTILQMLDSSDEDDEDEFRGISSQDSDESIPKNKKPLWLQGVGGSEVGILGFHNNDDDEDEEQNNRSLHSSANATIVSSEAIAQATTTKRCWEEFWIELKSLIRLIIQHNRGKPCKKRILGISMLIITILVFIDLVFGSYIGSWLSSFILWMEHHGMEAVFAFVVIFVVSTLLSVPPNIMIFGAGYAFRQAIGSNLGVLVAIFACFMGSCIGAVIAFVRARYLTRDLVSQVLIERYPIIKAADQAIKQKGFRIMILLRLCPIVPFNGLNYVCGITGVPAYTFVHSLIGLLPFQIYTVVIGAASASLVSKHSGLIAWTALITSGIVIGVIALVFLWKIVKKELRKVRHVCFHFRDEFRGDKSF